jgi:hypothetical protein
MLINKRTGKRTMTTSRRAANREAQAKLRSERKAAGIIQLLLWVPKGDSAASLAEVADFARCEFANGRTITAAAIDAATGRRVSLKARS